MTKARLARTLRHLRHAHDDDESNEGGELSLVPYLDIVVNIVMFLLATVAFTASVSAIELQTKITTPAPGPDPAPPSLSLTVHVSHGGLRLASRDGVQAPLPDLPSLHRALLAIKAQHPDELELVVSADADIPYEQVVAAMDAARSDGGHPLFPAVSLAAGVQ
jgi:biopolymer transport protein ExbD